MACLLLAGRQQNQGVEQGVTGPKFLGVRELTYKLAFMACATQVDPFCHWVMCLPAVKVRLCSLAASPTGLCSDHSPPLARHRRLRF